MYTIVCMNNTSYGEFSAIIAEEAAVLERKNYATLADLAADVPEHGSALRLRFAVFKDGDEVGQCNWRGFTGEIDGDGPFGPWNSKELKSCNL